VLLDLATAVAPVVIVCLIWQWRSSGFAPMFAFIGGRYRTGEILVAHRRSKRSVPGPAGSRRIRRPAPQRRQAHRAKRIPFLRGSLRRIFRRVGAL
jgi:hypothetical protein